MDYLQEAKVICTESQTQACDKIESITQREVQYLKEMMTQILRIFVCANDLQTTD